jgi:hypothetical protein
MVEWRYSSTILDLDTMWEISGQFHAADDLPPREVEEAGWTPEPV